MIRLLAPPLALLLCLASGDRLSAAVAVIANRTDTPIRFDAIDTSGNRQSRTLAAGESAPFFSSSPLTVSFPTQSGPRRETLNADAMYWLTTVNAGGRQVRQLRRIGLEGVRPAPPRPGAWEIGTGRADNAIRVLLCVDEEEPMHEVRWKDRLAKRLAKASEIIQRHSGVRFEVAGYAYWRSNNQIVRFEETLREFEKNTKTPEGVLAIGFSSQYRVERGRRRLGGTRGPLRNHIMLREWSPRVSESERVELLVHELGHFLGAAHSPEPTSVMRPVLGDRPVRLKEERICFDAVNTLAIAMVGEEVRRRGSRQLNQISATRRTRLQQLYGTLAALTPGEPAAITLLQRLEGAKRGQPSEVVSGTDRFEAEAARVVEAITQAASANQKRPAGSRFDGDRLTDALVQAAAQTGVSPKALLVGLGVGLDDSGALRQHPRTSKLVAGIEPDAARRRRLNVLGRATARGRGDSLKHFLVSAALAAILGEKEADLWGVGKELADATRPGGSGFSFADLAADRAGVRFARGLLTGKTPVAGLARSFRVENYVPRLDDLPEGLKLSELLKQYGGQGDPRFDAQIEALDKRIEALPPYTVLELGF